VATDKSQNQPSGPVGALVIIKPDLPASLRLINVCDPECRGRCLVCPQEVAEEAAKEIELLHAAIKETCGTIAKRLDESSDEITEELTDIFYHPILELEEKANGKR